MRATPPQGGSTPHPPQTCHTPPDRVGPSGGGAVGGLCPLSSHFFAHAKFFSIFLFSFLKK